LAQIIPELRWTTRLYVAASRKLDAMIDRLLQEENLAA
jgi:hypothetical protein